MTETLQTPIVIGGKVRHIKRGSDYTVIGQFWNFGGELLDNEPALLMIDNHGAEIVPAGKATKAEIERSWLTLPVTIQVSKIHAYDVIWIAYQGEAGVFARPLPEFTTDRFERLI